MFNWVLNYNDKPDEQQTRFLSDLIEYAVSNYDSAATIIRNSKPKNIDCKKVLFKTTEVGSLMFVLLFLYRIY